MTLRDIRTHVGQLLLTGFDGLSLPPELRAIAREFDLGGLIVASRNVEAPEQVAEYAIAADDLRQEVPLWVAAAREGGGDHRLEAPPFTRWPPLITLGRAKDVGLARRFARALALELRAVGITLDFAPVLDVLTKAGGPGAVNRALSDRAEDVATLGRAIIETVQGEGLAAAGRHFPGLGAAPVEPGGDLPVRDLPPDHVRAVECVPFRAAIEAQAACLMTAHVLLPAFDETSPASLSSAVVQDLLKNELGFAGAVLTGDLDDPVVAARYSIDRAAVAALRAGSDGLVLGGADYDGKARALEAVIRAAEAERAFQRRVEDAVRRMNRVKPRFLGAARARPEARRVRATLGLLEHQMVAEEMRQWL